MFLLLWNKELHSPQCVAAAAGSSRDPDPKQEAMLVTVFCAPRDSPETTFALDVSPELELRDFIALCELESGIPAGEIQVRPRELT